VKKAYTARTNVNRMNKVAPLVKIAYDTAFKGDYWTALTLNGLIYSSVLGYTSSVAIDALEAGAFAAGLSGTGPAVSAFVSPEHIDTVKTAWQAYEGDILEAQINHETAKVLEKPE
jgi:shikimate kinase